MPEYTASNPLEINGQTLEGGGQLVRIALGLSALAGTPIHISNIRGGRSGGGGLKPQHIACITWLAQACNATVNGATKGSRAVTFTPGGHNNSNISPGFTKRTLPDGSQVYECRIDIASAGSTTLALQAVLPFILFSRLPSQLPIHIHLTGGTCGSGSPSFEYIAHVLLPTLHTIGLPKMHAILHQRGWTQGSASIGHITLEIPPRASTILPTFTLHPSDPDSIPPLPSHLYAIFLGPASSHSLAASLLLPAIHSHFASTFTLDSPSSSSSSSSSSSQTSISSQNLTLTLEDTHHPQRIYFILIATISPSPSSSSPPKPPYILARDHLPTQKSSSSPTHPLLLSTIIHRVTADLADDWRSGAWVDEHMRDQLVVFRALAEGRCAVYPGRQEGEGEGGGGKGLSLREASRHTRTAEWVVQRMVGTKFDAEGGCEGVGCGREMN